eukprot:380540-Amphidinium_carterae.2
MACSSSDICQHLSAVRQDFVRGCINLPQGDIALRSHTSLNSEATSFTSKDLLMSISDEHL